MPSWPLVSEWMAHNYLDEFARLTRTFTIAYRITDDSGDSWTARFNRFKNKDKEACLGGGQLFFETVPTLMNAIGAVPADSTFIPALSLGELTSAPLVMVTPLKLRARKDHKKLFDSTLALAHNMQGAKFANAPR